MVPMTTKAPRMEPGARPVAMVAITPIAVLPTMTHTPRPPCSEPNLRSPRGRGFPRPFDVGTRRASWVPRGPVPSGPALSGAAPSGGRPGWLIGGRAPPGGVLPGRLAGFGAGWAGILSVGASEAPSPQRGSRVPGSVPPGSRPFRPASRLGTPASGPGPPGLPATVLGVPAVGPTGVPAGTLGPPVGMTGPPRGTLGALAGTLGPLAGMTGAPAGVLGPLAGMTGAPAG